MKFEEPFVSVWVPPASNKQLAEIALVKRQAGDLLAGELLSAAALGIRWRRGIGILTRGSRINSTLPCHNMAPVRRKRQFKMEILTFRNHNGFVTGSNLALPRCRYPVRARGYAGEVEGPVFICDAVPGYPKAWGEYLDDGARLDVTVCIAHSDLAGGLRPRHERGRNRYRNAHDQYKFQKVFARYAKLRLQRNSLLPEGPGSLGDFSVTASSPRHPAASLLCHVAA